MAVVPGVVVHQGGSVGHPGYLVAVVPPRHHTSIVGCVLTQPVVGLTEVVEDVPGAGVGEATPHPHVCSVAQHTAVA